MSVEAFLDSNVLLYAASKDPADQDKSACAARLIAETNFGVSLQLIGNSFFKADAG